MKPHAIPTIGLIQASLITLMVAFYNVYLKTVIELYDVHPVAFACICLISCAFVLMLASGPGRLSKETMGSPATWAYGIILIFLYLLDMFIMQFMSGTEASLLNRITAPLAALVAWLAFKRQQSKGDIIGGALMVVGIAWLVYLQPVSILWVVLGAGLGIALLDLIQMFITEFHRESTIAHEHGNIRDKARVIGFVTFSTSLCFLLTMLAISGLKLHLTSTPWLAYFPDFHSYAHHPTIISAIIFGAAILPLLRYCKWASTYNIKTENVFIFLAFVPALTFGLEYLTSLALGLHFNQQAFAGERGLALIAITFIITLAGLITGYYKLKEHHIQSAGTLPETLKSLRRGEDNSLASGFSPNAKDDYDAVVITLEQCEHDEALAARLLDVPLHALQAVHRGRGKQAFHPSLSPRVARHFRQHVALADPLTGLANRMSFMTQLSDLLNARQKVALLFIDLNHFKPINDTYGHDAGDSVLKTVAQRLLHLAPAQARVGRLGGDEFVIALTGPALKHAQTLATHITQALAEPILLTSDLPHVTISASVGLALSTPNTTAPNLIKSADANMYQLKKGR